MWGWQAFLTLKYATLKYCFHCLKNLSKGITIKRLFLYTVKTRKSQNIQLIFWYRATVHKFSSSLLLFKIIRLKIILTLSGIWWNKKKRYWHYLRSKNNSTFSTDYNKVINKHLNVMIQMNKRFWQDDLIATGYTGKIVSLFYPPNPVQEVRGNQRGKVSRQFLAYPG